MPLEVSIHLRYLHQDKGVKISQLLKDKKWYKKYSKSNIYRHAKMAIGEIKEDGWHFNEGRPCLLTAKDKRVLIRSRSKLCTEVGCFNVRRLRVEAGIDPEISDVTVRHCLNSESYKHLQARKKGLMIQKDVKERVGFVWRVNSKLPASF